MLQGVSNRLEFPRPEKPPLTNDHSQTLESQIDTSLLLAITAVRNCTRGYLKNHTAELHPIFAHVACMWLSVGLYVHVCVSGDLRYVI